MSMIVMQTAIARLCVDAEFRQALLSDPNQTLERLDLTSEEIESIKALDMLAIDEYAGSLLSKRTGLIKKWFSVSFSLLELRLGSHRTSHILRHYGLEQIRDGDELGGEWVRHEFDQFHSYLRDLISGKKIDVPGFSDLLEFEALRFSMALDPEVSSCASEFSQVNSQRELVFTDEFKSNFKPVLGLHARVHSFDYNIPVFIEQFEEEAQAASLELESIDVLFFKKAHNLGVDINIINLPLKNLLAACDGEQPINRILSSIVSKHAPLLDVTEEELIDDCLDILGQLHAAGVITFIN